MEERIRLVYGDIRVNEPVPYDVYDGQGHKVMVKGMRWVSEGQLRLILSAGVFRLLESTGLRQRKTGAET
jgi:hypothetical protein